MNEVEKALDFNLTESMIDACHRLGKKTGPNNSPPGIIVKFVRRLDKDELLRKRRVRRDFSTRHMNLNVDKPVYINEALSPARRRLSRWRGRSSGTNSTSTCGCEVEKSSFVKKNLGQLQQ
ncbi:hypothetical protein J6590_082971 [Homalodisca vitripennis]|nr:hypothetical protein J6590_082971 [Homalodisca vitripennis]